MTKKQNRNNLGTEFSKDEFGNKQYNCNIYTVSGEEKTAKLNRKVYVGIDHQNQ